MATVLVYITPSVECQGTVSCRGTLSTVLTPNTDANVPLTMSCSVPVEHTLESEFAYMWEWDDLAPDNTVERTLPNVTEAMCEFVG